MMQVTKAGEVIVEFIEIGDVHYEFSGDVGCKMTVITEPTLNSAGNYMWESKSLKTGKIHKMMVNPQFPQYAPKLYTQQAYNVKDWI